MRQPKYSIGQKVCAVEVARECVCEACPDCLGRKTWQAITPAGEGYIIRCPSCDALGGSTGHAESYVSTGAIRTLTIGSVQMDTAAPEDRQVGYMCEETGVGSGTVWREGALYPHPDIARDEMPRLVETHRRNLIESRARSRAKTAKQRIGSMVAHYERHIRQAEKEIREAREGLARERRGGR